MKRCKTCGKLNWDGATTCENCHEEFVDKPVIIPDEGKGLNIPVIAGVILMLVGIIFFIIDIVHLKISTISILYMAAGSTLISTKAYHEYNDKKIEILQAEIHQMMKEIKELKEKNAE